MNGDGNADLLATRFDGVVSGIVVALGRGDGTWLSSSVSVLLGRGDGSLEPKSDYGTAGSNGDIAGADLDGDGRPDLVVTNGTSGTGTVLLSGDRDFLPEPPVAIEVEDLEARPPNGEPVVIQWILSNAAVRDLASIVVQRAPQPAGPYEARSLPLTPARMMRFEDIALAPGSECWYRLVLEALDGPRSIVGPVGVRRAEPGSSTTILPVSAETDGSGTVQIRYTVGRSQASVRLDLFDVTGRRVRAWPLADRQMGSYTLVWDRTNAAGARVARGVYFLRLEAGATVATRKFALAWR